MTEAALTLSEQKNHNMGELLTRLKAEKEERREQQSRERKKEQEVKNDWRRDSAQLSFSVICIRNQNNGFFDYCLYIYIRICIF